MRVLFSGAPAGGHLFPMLPLARAAVLAGDEVEISTGRGGASLIPGYRVREHGPSMLEALAETRRRTGGDDGTDPGAATAELFGGVRPEGAIADGVFDAAESFAPELVVSEAMDEVGPLVAAALGVPLVVHTITGPVPHNIMAGITVRADRVLEEHGLARIDGVASVDPFPRVLLTEAERRSMTDSIAIRPAVHAEADSPRWERPPGIERPLVLISLGTTVTDATALQALAEAAEQAGGIAVVTTPKDMAPPPRTSANAHWVGFVPLNDLLPHVDVVASAGGTGTVLAALSHGIPLVIRPFLADQFWNAQRLDERGLAVTIAPDNGLGGPDRDAARAIRTAIADGGYRRRAERVQREIARTGSPSQVWARLRDLATTRRSAAHG